MSAIDFDIQHLVPAFLYRDKNGHALSKAIEAGMKYAARCVEEGIALTTDPSAMPEWRLDEMAWEYNILYDYNADIETKREWIANAVQFYSLYGTPAGVERYLQAMFDSANVEEWQDYGGDPYHFRVTVTGVYSEASDEWARRSVENVKNVRSVLDAIIFNAGSVTATLKTGAAATGTTIEDTVTMQ